MLSLIVGTVCLSWYYGALIVCAVGYIQLFRNYSKAPKRAISESLPRDEIPHLTIIRPVKGLEPRLYECLAATYQLTYPKEKLTVYLCVSSHDDPAVPTLNRLVQEFQSFDTRLFIEEDDPMLNSSAGQNFGANPKIRNMSRAYREAKGDIVWIVDCNVWVGKGVAGRMVDTLCGYGRSKRYKFVHQLPLVVDLLRKHSSPSSGLLGSQDLNEAEVASTSTAAYEMMPPEHLSNTDGGHGSPLLTGTDLEELFLASSHAKWYTAINTVLIAPCIVGKSNMFRRSHLYSLTENDPDGRPPGIDFFSHNICEDHLIGDLLWKRQVPEETGPQPERIGKHALVLGDLAIQPMAGMSISEYVARRVRWLRVRKFTVPAATFVEPGTESLLCSLYGAYGMYSVPWVHDTFGFPQTLTAAAIFWIVSIAFWALVDWTQYLLLHSGQSVETDQNTPDFAGGPRGGYRRKFPAWFVAWLGREFFALPIWTMAVYGGVTVAWRGKRFRVGLDARVRAVDDQDSTTLSATNFRHANGYSKSRME